MQKSLHSLCCTDVSELIPSFPTGDTELQFPFYKGKSIPAQGLQQYFNELHSLESCGEPFHASVFLLFEWTAAVGTKS